MNKFSAKEQQEQQARVVRGRRACYTFRDSRLVIRDIESLAEMNTIEEMQREVWGFSDLEIVPASELLVAREVGGCLIGAFEGDQLAGFVYGLLGLDAGELSIHSDMLAVDPRYRGLNLGYGLKLAQRRAALERGIRRITWTFDPLLSLNAHLNFQKLGVVADQYRINFYGGGTTSALYRDGTDRLWVTWLLDSPRVVERLKNGHGSAAIDAGGPLRAVRCAADLTPCVTDSASVLESAEILIEIPSTRNPILADPRLSSAWRSATRLAFTSALEHGYSVREFVRFCGVGDVAGAYLLARDSDSPPKWAESVALETDRARLGETPNGFGGGDGQRARAHSGTRPP